VGSRACQQRTQTSRSLNPVYSLGCRSIKRVAGVWAASGTLTRYSTPPLMAPKVNPIELSMV